MRTFPSFPTRSLFDELNNLFEETTRPRDTHQLFSTEDGWAIRLDLPGFEKDDLVLNFEDKALLLTAESKDDAEFKRPSVIQRFALGEEVDSFGITAKLELGVLEIQLPRKEETEEQTKQITIN